MASLPAHETGMGGASQRNRRNMVLVAVAASRLRITNIGEFECLECLYLMPLLYLPFKRSARLNRSCRNAAEWLIPLDSWKSEHYDACCQPKDFSNAFVPSGESITISGAYFRSGGIALSYASMWLWCDISGGVTP